MNKETAKELRNEIVNSCPLLYLGAKEVKDAEFKHFGFECGDGWLYKIQELSNLLEFYNRLTYGKYRCYIRAAQVKEKFGTLRFYYDVVQDPTPFFKWGQTKLVNLGKRLKKCDFKMTKVVDEPFHVEKTHEALTKEEYDEELKGIKCVNVKLYEKDGQYWRDAEYNHYEKYHYEPTSHVLRWKISEFLKSIGWKFGYIGFSLALSMRGTDGENAAAFLETNADILIRKFEDEIYGVCEDCGWNIGDKHYPRCETTGWITYLCKSCADKSGREYINHSDNKHYKNGVECAKESKEPKDAKDENA